MLFSIIIPVYNVEAYLKECLDSVLSQNFDNVELICVNDGSTDGSLAILKDYQSRFTAKIKLINQLNGGLSAARNTAIHAASGEYLLFLDSDDILAEGSLAKLTKIIEKESPDIIAFNSELFYEENCRFEPNTPFNHTENTVFEKGMGYFDYFMKQRNWGPSAVCFYLFRRTLFVENQLRFEVGISHEDELFMPQALYYARKTCTLTDTLYKYRMRFGSIIHSQTDQNYVDKLRIAEKLFDFFQSQHINDKFVDRTVYNLSLAGVQGLMHTEAGRKKISVKSKKLMVDAANTGKEKMIAGMIRLYVKLYKTYFEIIH
jgi:glycosyltransferase involved in cell wall biosynthesis